MKFIQKPSPIIGIEAKPANAEAYSLRFSRPWWAHLEGDKEDTVTVHLIDHNGVELINSCATIEIDELQEIFENFDKIEINEDKSV